MSGELVFPYYFLIVGLQFRNPRMVVRALYYLIALTGCYLSEFAPSDATMFRKNDHTHGSDPRIAAYCSELNTYR